MASCVPISDPRLEEIRQETQADETMQILTDESDPSRLAR